MSDDKLWYIEGKPLPYKLHSIDLSPNRYDMHGDVLAAVSCASVPNAIEFTSSYE